MPNPRTNTPARTTEHYGGGQSGYGSGRFGDDPSMGAGFRNQASWNPTDEDHQAMHTDDRFTGRGGEGYWEALTEHRGPEPGGVHHLEDGNFGQPEEGFAHSDDRIKELVREALADDDHIDASHIEVVVKNSEVMLTGLVDERWQKQRAEAVVARLTGIKSVQNQVRCRSERRGNPNTGGAVGTDE